VRVCIRVCVCVCEGGGRRTTQTVAAKGVFAAAKAVALGASPDIQTYWARDFLSLEQLQHREREIQTHARIHTHPQTYGSERWCTHTETRGMRGRGPSMPVPVPAHTHTHTHTHTHIHTHTCTSHRHCGTDTRPYVRTCTARRLRGNGHAYEGFAHLLTLLFAVS
jgi:hypothetical protein